MWRAFGAIAVLLFAAIAGYFWIEQRWRAAGPSSSEQVVEFARGARLGDIAEALERAGAVPDARLFLIGLFLDAAGRNLKAGEYAIPSASSMSDIAALLRSGKVLLHRVTLVEGRTVGEAIAEMARLDFLSGTVEVTPQEGSLHPDTYLVTRHADIRAVLGRMTAAQDALVDEIWRNALPPPMIRDRRELLILASIIEKETGREDERPLVAAVFENRLALHMKLQSDPTVAYGLTMGASELGRDLTRDDLQRTTPWNTYVIDGLPPTAIANPGRKSLEAVMKPAASDALYFVADGTGGHVFARSLDEHNRNVAKYRELLSERVKGGPQ